MKNLELLPLSDESKKRLQVLQWVSLINFHKEDSNQLRM